ncbi:MAG: hypothetical protein RIC06_11105 [Cyclobacteriaceae bacterium]
MTYEEKCNALLIELYRRRENGSHLGFGKLFDSLEIEIYESDIRRLADDLEEQGLIDQFATKDNVAGRITGPGIKEAEYLLQLPSEEEAKEMSEKVDELIFRLRKTELGQEIIFDEVQNGLLELKEHIPVTPKNKIGGMIKSFLVQRVGEEFFNEIILPQIVSLGKFLGLMP